MITKTIDFVTLGAQLGIAPPGHENTEKMAEAFEAAHKAWLKATVEARKIERQRAVEIMTVLHGIFDDEKVNFLPRTPLVAVALTKLQGVTLANVADVETQVLKAIQEAGTVFTLRGGKGRAGVTVYRIRTKAGKETGVEVPPVAEAPQASSNGATAAS